MGFAQKPVLCWCRCGVAEASTNHRLRRSSPVMNPKNESPRSMMLMRHEALLRELWTTHLGVPPEVESDFMRAGGSSLLLMEIQLGIQNRSEIWIDLVLLRNQVHDVNQPISRSLFFQKSIRRLFIVIANKISYIKSANQQISLIETANQ